MTVTYTPLPPAPVPGASDFEVQAGVFLDAMPVFGAEMKAIADNVAENATLVDVEGNATIAATAASQASISATQAGNSATASAASASSALVSATAARRDAEAAALSALQTATNSVAAASSAAAAAASAELADSEGNAASALDSKVAAQAARDVAIAQAGIATTKAAESYASADAAAGSVASALAIYGNTAAQQAAVTAAQNAASVAAGHAASASSVVQQDLSGVNAAALHRSPNAVTAMFVYDTGKDSDGGAWTEKCQHTSWYNEAINGKWLGAQASEAAARAVSGATTGDYFQLTTDGKFYRLNATSGTTEVFRGNKRDFPRLAAIVAEASSVTIYDLTEPGRPMWMRFIKLGSFTRSFIGYDNSGKQISSVSMLNGVLCTGNANNGALGVILIASDRAYQYAASERIVFSSGVANRNVNQTAVEIYGASITNGTIKAVAMTVLPDAPVDPVTGLQVPTIAVATDGGVSVIKHNGTVVNSSSTGSFSSIALSLSILSVGRGDYDWYYALNPGSLGSAFGLTTKSYASAPDFGRSNTTRLVSGPTRGDVLRVPTGAMVQRLKNNEATVARGVAATITNTFNTGHQVGDIRRTYLSDIEAGSVGPSTELVTNGDFSNGITGWSASSGLHGTGTSYVAADRLSASNGALTITNSATSGTYTYAWVAITVTPNKAYRVSFNLNSATTNARYFEVWANGQVVWKDWGVFPLGRNTYTFTATVSTIYLSFGCYDASQSITISDVSLTDAYASDRSYKSNSSRVFGTLTKTAVASAAQLVAYSGFSAANYLRESYSADLDFGTGEWSASAWVSIPTANAAAGIIASRAHSSGAYITLGIDATNKLTATAYDGTTTRTVTTTAAYNTATWLKVRANYTTDGSLALLVNGQEVAVTRGNPLLTLNNANAVLTIGNSYALDAPFPGSIALLKLSATVPTPEQSVWMYQQEKQMFREGAQVCLPDSGSIVDLTYDDATDKWIAVSATNESEWSGLVRTSVTPVPAGSYTKASAASGVQLLARSTTNPGVDITIPAFGLREELVRRAESAARLARSLTPFDYVGGFTASTTNGSTSITSVAGLSYPTSYVGAKVTGSGIPADTVITAVSGTTIYLSKAATATATGVQISFTDFILPVGYEAKAVLSAGSVKTEGSTKDYTRLFDGFRETIRFGTAPGYQAAVQIQATRSAA